MKRVVREMLKEITQFIWRSVTAAGMLHNVKKSFQTLLYIGDRSASRYIYIYIAFYWAISNLNSGDKAAFENRDLTRPLSPSHLSFCDEWQNKSRKMVDGITCLTLKASLKHFPFSVSASVQGMVKYVESDITFQLISALTEMVHCPWMTMLRKR